MSKSIAFGVEQVIGTAVTPDKALIVNPSDGLQVNMGRNEYAPLNGTRFGVQAMVDGQVEIGGSLEMAIDKGLFAFPLLGLLGAPVTTEVDAANGVFRHVFSPAEDLRSLTIEQWNGIIAQLFSGVVPSSAAFSLPIDDLASVEYELLALANSTSESHTTPAWTCDVPYNHTQVKIYIDDVEAPNTADAEVEIAADTEAVYGYPKDAQRYKLGRVTASGSLTYYLTAAADALAFYQKYINGDPVNLKIVLEAGAIGASSENYKVEIEIARAILTQANDPMDDEVERFELEFTGTVDCPTQEYVKVTVVNDLESYVD